MIAPFGAVTFGRRIANDVSGACHPVTSEDQLKSWMIGGLEGSAADHSALLRSLAPLLRSYYRRRARGSEDDIEDLVQETIIAVHTRRGTYDRERPFTAWLFAIARYKMVDNFRRTRRLVPLDDLAEWPSEECFADAADARMDVEQLLGLLPDKQAAAIRSTRIEGSSVSEAAARAGLGESDIKVSVHRGLKALVARVQRDRP
ncbi:sigma-70 family RNA polymerase sigma factor [Rhizorhabdus sp. FW153]|uniref:sigma-70 family RNA polymerase sigma factor n=1 Tax=Rhizorhabdus sp. FW153 TaxID=3400216 RepID=UPI003CE7FA8A